MAEFFQILFCVWIVVIVSKVVLTWRGESDMNLIAWFKKRIQGSDFELMMDRDEHIELMTANYLSIVDQGLDLYDFMPESPTGAMATNRYAQESYTRQMIAFSGVLVSPPRCCGKFMELSGYDQGDTIFTCLECSNQNRQYDLGGA